MTLSNGGCIEKTNSVSAYVRRCAAEVRLLKQHITSAETVVLQNIKAVSAGDATKIALQDLDLFAQSADAISLFLDQLAKDIPNECEVDAKLALEKITLARVKARLSDD